MGPRGLPRYLQELRRRIRAGIEEEPDPLDEGREAIGCFAKQTIGRPENGNVLFIHVKLSGEGRTVEHYVLNVGSIPILPADVVPCEAAHLQGGAATLFQEVVACGVTPIAFTDTHSKDDSRRPFSQGFYLTHALASQLGKSARTISFSPSEFAVEFALLLRPPVEGRLDQVAAMQAAILAFAQHSILGIGESLIAVAASCLPDGSQRLYVLNPSKDLPRDCTPVDPSELEGDIKLLYDCCVTSFKVNCWHRGTDRPRSLYISIDSRSL